MDDEELQEKIERLLKQVSDNVPSDSETAETEAADGHGALRAPASEALVQRDEALLNEGEHDDHVTSWLVGDDVSNATSSTATPSSSSQVPSSAARAVPTASRRFWGPPLTAAVKANMRRLAKASVPPRREEARYEGEEAGADEFAVSPEARKTLASIGHSLERGDLQSWELHNAVTGLTRKLLKATSNDPVVLEEGRSNAGICMGASIPDLGVRVSIPISPALHGMPEGRAVVGQLVAALALLRLHGLEPASIGRAKREARDRLLRQSLSEYAKKKEKKEKKEKVKKDKKEKKEKKEAKREDKKERTLRAKNRKIASEGAAKTATEARPVGRQASREEALKTEVVRSLQLKPMTVNELAALYGCRLKETGKKIRFKKWLLEIKGVSWGGKSTNPLLTWKPTSQRHAEKRARSRSPRRVSTPPGNFGAAMNPPW